MRSSTLVLGLIVGAVALPASQAAAGPYGNADATKRIVSAQHAQGASAAERQRAAQLKARKKQHALAASRVQKAKQLKAQQQPQNKKWYEDDRERGLDVAAKYAPDTIARVRKRQYIAKGDTVRTGKGKTGWQHYMGKYYAR